MKAENIPIRRLMNIKNEEANISGGNLHLWKEMKNTGKNN